VRRLLARLWKRTRELWERARREHSTPREVGWSVGVGVFCGCTPFLGLHMWLALLLASVLRLNRLWAFLGSRVSTNLLFVWIAFSEIELAHRLRAGTWAPLAPSEVLAQGKQLFGDWALGTPLIGGPLAVILGLMAYASARRWRARELTAHTPDAPRPPSSGSRPSAPPAPTS
jgi:uncharacterized protein (DUF2062 family)